MNEDIRYKQLESETELESKSAKSKFAFTGFGRSTDLSAEVDKVLEEAEKRKKQLAVVINFEEQLKGAGDDQARIKFLSDALNAARTQLDKMSEQASQRRLKLSQELMNTGVLEGNKQAAKLKFRNTFKPKKYKQTQRLKVLKASPKQTTLKQSMQGFAPAKSIGKITAVGRSKHFGSQKTFSNHNA